jgi:type IV pilus assembly protein PilO
MAAKPTAAPAGSALDRLPPIGKAGVGLLFVVLVGLLYFVIFYSDLDNDITSARRREQQLTAELAKAQKSKEEYQKDLDEKTRAEQLAREQKKILPDEPEMPNFLSDLQGVATVSGVNLMSWTPTDEVIEEFYARLPMKLTLKGKFHQVVKFFHGAEQIVRIINIENIHIKDSKAGGDEVEVEVECLATAFRSVRPGETPSKRRGTTAGAGH